jgi:hypothetical protein
MQNLPNKKTTLTTLASLVAASSAQASIINGAAVAISASANGGLDSQSSNWDIDGNSSNETRFVVQHHTYNYYSQTYITASIKSGSTAVAPFGFLKSGSALKAVSENSSVGSPGLFATELRLRRTSFGSTYSTLLTQGTPSPITVGFRFDRDGATHYGVADLSYTFSPGSEAILNLDNVSWNDVAGQGITGGRSAVPEPASAATALGLLALGAAGLRRMRKTKAA